MPTEPVELSVELEARWEQRADLAARARAAALDAARAQGLDHTGDIDVAVSCKGKRCTALVTALGLPRTPP